MSAAAVVRATEQATADAELVTRHGESDWRALMLAVDLGGATVVPHSALQAEPA
ncbi:hypothetical protein IAE22_28370 [Bacillus sp. S34]|nr:hypothetical protein [Bacillus sp. S34]